MELDRSAVAAGVRLIVHDSVASTNAEAIMQARAGERGPLWIVAHRQTAGRGRRGRTWHSPAGNLYASLLVTEACAPERAAQLSFVAALALHDALAALAPDYGARLQLKWPNDLLLDGAKIAGILIEGESGEGRFATVIGMGINCTAHPPDTPYPATNLAEAGLDIAPERLLPKLSRTMLSRLVQWQRGDNFAATCSEWLTRAARRGERICLRGATEAEGVFEGIDAQGRLLLRESGGTVRAFSAGEVQWAAPAEGEGDAA